MKTSTLIEAVLMNDIKLIKKLISKGADINEQDANLFTPLHYAVQENFYEIVKLLVDAGADLEIKDKFGNTPLIRAVSSFMGDGSIIKFLLQSGANRDTKNNSGISAFEWASNVANYNIVQFFGSAE